MNIRCSFCQTPYTIGRIEKLDALQEMDSKKLSHYDSHCPRCRRANPIPRPRLEATMPNWRDGLKELEVEMKENPQHEAPLPTAEAAPVAEAEPAPEPKAVKEKKPAAKKAPAAQKPETATAPKEKRTAKKSK